MGAVFAICEAVSGIGMPTESLRLWALLAVTVELLAFRVGNQVLDKLGVS